MTLLNEIIDLRREKITLDLLLHGNRVAELSALIAAGMGLGIAGCIDAARASNLHDLGKIYVPEHILNKPGELTREEFREMQQHPVYSLDIVKQIEPLKRYARIVMLHHENYDGSGYFGVKGNDIPLLSRIITIADCYDAMTNDRPYKKTYSPEEAVKEMVKEAKYKYDPKIFGLFLQVIDKKIKQDSSRETA